MKTIQDSNGQPAPRAAEVSISAGSTGPFAGLGGRIARTGALGLAAVAIGFLMCGCGASSEEDTNVRVTTGVNKPTAQRATPGKTPSAGAVAESRTEMASNAIAKSHVVANAPAPQPEQGTPTALEGLPPDIVVSTSDSVSAPGQLIYVTVRATDDVSQIVLRDGIGDSQGLAYDEDAGLWRVTYRIPLSAPWERIGLSVTAKNRDDRWCRVWKFVRIKEESANSQIKLTVGS